MDSEAWRSISCLGELRVEPADTPISHLRRSSFDCTGRFKFNSEQSLSTWGLTASCSDPTGLSGNAVELDLGISPPGGVPDANPSAVNTSDDDFNPDSARLDLSLLHSNDKLGDNPTAFSGDCFVVD